jgi:hypothetical protein
MARLDDSDRPFIASSTRFVLALATPRIPEGLLAKALFEAEGIPVVLKGESEGPYRMGPVYLFVPEDFEVTAQLILAEALAQGSSSDGAARGSDPTASSTEEPSGPS